MTLSKNSLVQLGPVLWILSAQYFIAQVIAASYWSTQFSLSGNTISDLGNTVCGVYSGKFVCSPLHSWMNASFIILGITQALGAWLIYYLSDKSPGKKIGFSFMALAGLGTAIVGLFPENSVSALHILGAALPFVLGNLALIILGRSLKISPKFRHYTIASGVLALIALALFLSHYYLGLGTGGAERFTVYPQTIWMIALGFYLLRGKQAQGLL